MTLFLLLLTNIIPLYLIIAAGFVGGRYLGVDRQSLANVALYFCVPVVVFGFVVHLDLRPAYALLPVISFGISCVVAAMFYRIGKAVYADGRANLLTLCTSMGNTGYFGLPVVMLMFDPQWVALYMFMMVGITTFEATFGYYIAARGRYSVRDSLIKLAKFPSIYAMLVGLAVNFSGAEMPDLFETYWAYFKGAYVILGMMIIGAALGQSRKLEFVPKFIALAFFGKFIVWPAVTFVLVLADQYWFHMFEPEVYKLLFLMAVVPQAANVAAFSAQMNLNPEKAATTILAGTVFALFYIPLFMGLIGFY